jgi:UDP-N-acetylglucosamine:LPS N-acetylglucosamine transferase
VKEMKLLVVLGEGGHTTELLNLIDLLGDRYQYHYIVTEQDKLSADQIRIEGKIHRLLRPRGKDTSLPLAAFRTLVAAYQALRVLLRVRPKAILSTGPAIAVPVAILGKLLGARVIFVETGSRIRTVSMTGRIMYRWADLFFVQWPQLTEKLPRAIYAGRLI